MYPKGLIYFPGKMRRGSGVQWGMNNETIPQWVDGRRVIAAVLNPDGPHCYALCELNGVDGYVVVSCNAERGSFTGRWTVETKLLVQDLARGFMVMADRITEFQNNAALDNIAAALKDK